MSVLYPYTKRSSGCASMGHFRDAAHGLANGFIAVAEIPVLEACRFPLLGTGPIAVTDPGGVREEVANGDGAGDVDDFVAAVVLGYGHRRGRVFGQEVADRLGDKQRAAFLGASGRPC